MDNAKYNTDFQDKKIMCIDCKKVFKFNVREQIFYYRHDLSEPRRCYLCRKEHNANRSVR